MTPLEAARKLSNTGNAPYHSNKWGMMWCGCCNGSMDQFDNHNEDCPWLQWPQIITALEEGQQAIREAARMREVLAWYADENNYREGAPGKNWVWDNGQRARAVLAAERAEPGRE